MTEAEKSPLVWPQAQARVRVQDQKNNSAWKKSWRDYLAALAKEFKRMEVTSYHVTFNESGMSRDPGVAVWFSRKHEESYKWQDILGIENPYPTIAEIDNAYRRLIQKYHPDRHLNEPNFDTAPFVAMTEARLKAIAFIKGTDKQAHDYVIACDQYREARQNLYAVVGTIQSIRRIQWKIAINGLFEELDDIGIGATQKPSGEGTSAKWESWKSRLGGKCPEMIDLLLINGEMTHTQMAAALRCHYNTAGSAIASMMKVGILQKNGGKFSLKG